MEVQEIYEKCMKGSLQNLIKGGLVYKYFRSPFFVWCEAFAPEEERDPKSAFIEMIFENGRNHEDEVCREMFPGGISIDPTLHEKAFIQSLEGFFRGEKYVKNGILYFLPEGFVAVPDVLEKKEGSSVFGNWHYEVVEIKSSKQIREEHIMQAAYYNHIMGIIQGFTPEKFCMIGRQKEREMFDYSEYEKKVKKTMQDIREIFRGKQPEAEKIGWPWENFSIKKLKESGAISLIPNLYSFHREVLAESGIKTLDDFLSPSAPEITGIKPGALDKYRRHARAILQGKHSFLEKPFLPEGRVEIFMDFEGVEQAVINRKKISGDYLIGALVRENGKEEFIPFVSETLEKEHEMLLEFLKFLKEKKEFVIYHFGSYEKSHLATMFHKYSIDEDFAQKIIGSMVDILQVARKSVVFPTHSYSLKELGKYLGFRWSDVTDAKDSVVLYLDFLNNSNRESLEKIIQYNKDDCTALKRVKDFLVWGT